LGLALCSHAVLTTYLVTAFEGHWQFVVFHISFGTAQVYALVMIVLNYLKRKQRNAADPAIWVFERGFMAYFAAFGCWFMDMLFCEYLNPAYSQSVLPVNPQFHAWWHVL
jgi:Ceramidase